MVIKEKCLAQLTGQCSGCNVAEIAKQRVKKGEKYNDAIQAVSKELCPEGESVQEEAVRLPKQSIW